MSTLLLEYWTEGDDFCMYAETDNYEKELTLTGQRKSITSKLNLIYEILENKPKNKADQLEQTVEALSQALIAPFSDQIKTCDLIRFLVYEDLIRSPLDLLLHEDKPLFLQRSICYQIDEGYGDDSPQLEVGSALLIADLTADPEEACKQVSKLIPDSQYAKMEEANLTIIKTSADQVDALVVSAHGDLDTDNCGGVWINDQAIRSKIIETLEAGIVYFDSCQQGSNMEFLQAFQEESEVQFYLAPIISNDAGDSSTRTMLWFFKDLLNHGNPIQALFETRKRLFDFYAIQEGLDAITSFNKSFAFRLYEFVES